MTDKKVTVRDLQTFIEAVEFASDQENWVPSGRQWARIREMIGNLDATPVQPQAQLYSPLQYPTGPLPSVPHAVNTPAHVPQTPAIPAGPSAFGGLPPSGPQYNMGGMHIPQGVPQIPAAFTTPRTPDIDTSGGSYTSSFT